MKFVGRRNFIEAKENQLYNKNNCKTTTKNTLSFIQYDELLSCKHQ